MHGCDGQNLKGCFQVLSRQQSRGHQGQVAISRQRICKSVLTGQPQLVGGVMLAVVWRGKEKNQGLREIPARS